jgi:hypothetical protein
MIIIALEGSSITSFVGIEISKITCLPFNAKKSQVKEPGSIPNTLFNEYQALVVLLIIKVQQFFVFLLIFNFL